MTSKERIQLEICLICALLLPSIPVIMVFNGATLWVLLLEIYCIPCLIITIIVLINKIKEWLENE